MLFMEKEDKKYFIYTSIKIKYSRRIYKKPVTMIIFKVKLKNHVVPEAKKYSHQWRAITKIQEPVLRGSHQQI